MPAEWEPHRATWIAWPHRRDDWPGKFAAIAGVYAEIVRHLHYSELVRILVNDARAEKRARRILCRAAIDFSRVEFFPVVTDRVWTRDYGPLFVTHNSGAVAIVDWKFNAWAKYPDWQKDNRIPALAARALRCRIFRAQVKGRDFVLEGGSIDVNGRGTLLTTEECLLDPKVQTRNPGLSRAEIEATLGAYLGATNVLWLGRGIAGDDTHGHVDDLCRFVGPRTVVLCREDNPADANYRLLEENRERLEGLRLEDGSRLEVAPLPMPAPVVFDGQRLPASYANFYISNSAVLVPTFNDPKDRVALGTLAELFGDRPVVGVNATDLVWGLGTLHCLTREQPAS